MTSKVRWIENPPLEETALVITLTPSQYQAALDADLFLYDRCGNEWLDSTPLVRVRIAGQIPR